MSDQQWKEWGKQNPYFGVYSDEKFDKANVDRNRAEFFATGQRSVDTFLERARQSYELKNLGRALEFGSGVGRLTIPLARVYAHVVGIEVSPDMIGEAKANCSRFGITNATFVDSDDALSKAEGKFDLVLSYIVLQHLVPERGLKIVDRLLDRLAPGGVAIIQASVQRPNSSTSKKLLYEIKHRFPRLKAAAGLVAGKGWVTLDMRMSEYNPIEILQRFAAHGMPTVIMTPHNQGSVLSYHFMAQRPDGST